MMSLHLLLVSQFITPEALVNFGVCHRAVRPAVQLSRLCQVVLTNASDQLIAHSGLLLALRQWFCAAAVALWL